jgi:hypothetical protein
MNIAALLWPQTGRCRSLRASAKIATSLGLSLLRNRGLAAKDIQTNDEAPAFARLRRGWRMTNDEGMMKHQWNVLARAQNQMSEICGQNSSLFRDGGLLAAKDVLLHLARRCFWQLGYETNFLRTLEVRQMITSVIAQLGFRRRRACF